MFKQKLIERKYLYIKDKKGKKYSFRVCVFRPGLYSTPNSLSIQVSYLLPTKSSPFPISVLSMDFEKLRNKTEYRTPENGLFWVFELPKDMQNKGIGSNLWPKIESFFKKHNISLVKGSPHVYSTSSQDEKKRAAYFWSKMGFKMYKKYPSSFIGKRPNI